MAQNGSQVTKQQLGSMVFGSAISFALHGLTSGQMIWYFRTRSNRGSKVVSFLVVFAWIGEALNCIFMFFGTLSTIFIPAMLSSQCSSWTGAAQGISSAMCTFTTEGFFVMRVWKLSEHKKLTALVFIPYIAGYVFGVAQIVRGFRVLCNSNAVVLNPVFIFGTFGCRIFGDGVIAVAMCYMLRKRSSGFTRHANTIKIVRGLILWSIATGLLTWFISVLFLISYLEFLRSGYAIFYIRGGLYVNAMLAQLNARTRFQTIAEESIPLSTINLGGTSSDPVDRESQPIGPTQFDSQY